MLPKRMGKMIRIQMCTHADLLTFKDISYSVIVQCGMYVSV